MYSRSTLLGDRFISRLLRIIISPTSLDGELLWLVNLAFELLPTSSVTKVSPSLIYSWFKIMVIPCIFLKTNHISLFKYFISFFHSTFKYYISLFIAHKSVFFLLISFPCLLKDWLSISFFNRDFYRNFFFF